MKPEKVYVVIVEYRMEARGIAFLEHLVDFVTLSKKKAKQFVKDHSDRTLRISELLFDKDYGN